jgi:hypothetical protein
LLLFTVLDTVVVLLMRAIQRDAGLSAELQVMHRNVTRIDQQPGPALTLGNLGRVAPWLLVYIPYSVESKLWLTEDKR